MRGFLRCATDDETVRRFGRNDDLFFSIFEHRVNLRGQVCSGSVLAVAAFDGVEEFGGVVADAVFEDDFDFFDVVDVGGGVAVDDDEVGVFAGGDAADGRLLPS